VFQFRSLFASLLIGLLSVPAAASDDPAVLVAALDVISTNSQGGPICEGMLPNPGRADRVKLAKLVAALPNPNAEYPFGYTDITPLGMAVLADDMGLLESLFAKGARWRKDSFDSMTMYEAAQHGSPAMIKALLNHGLAADVRHEGGWPGLMAAAWGDRLDNLKVLLEAGADARFALPNGNSALRGAVMCKNQDMVDVLVRHGARPDAKTRRLAGERGIHLPKS